MRFQPLRLALFFLLFSHFSLVAQEEYKFNEAGYEAVIKQAKAENKPVFYMFYASWCQHCHKMRSEVFPDPEISAFLQKNFLVAAQEVDQSGGKKLMRKYNITSFPSYVVIDNDGKLLYGFGGELLKDDFLKEIQAAANPVKQLPYLEKEFLADVSNPEKCIPYVTALRKAHQKTAETAQKYFASQSDAQLVSALNWKIIANGVSDIDSREFQYVLKHQQEFAAVASPLRVKQKIDNIVSESLQPLINNQDTVAYKKVRPLVQSIGLRSTDSLAFNFDRQMYEEAKDWKMYKKVTLEGTQKFAWGNYPVLRSIGSVYLAQIDDPVALSNAIKWVERSTEIQHAKDGYLLTAKLYEKIKDIPKAIAAAQQAREFCENIGFGTKEADEILARLQPK
jgi:thioredoxin-related protein